MSSSDLATGRAEALNKTITEIMKFMKDSGNRPGGPRARLRPFLREKVGDLAERWYKRGVRRGHIQSYEQFKATGRLSRRLLYETEREFFQGQNRQISITSRIKRKSRKK
jgi:hypothetical protein